MISPALFIWWGSYIWLYILRHILLISYPHYPSYQKVLSNTRIQIFLELFQSSLNLCMSSRQYHFLIYLMNNHSPPNTFLNKHTYIILRDFNIIISHYLCMLLHILNKSSILIRDICSILYLYTNHCCLFDQIVMLVF